MTQFTCSHHGILIRENITTCLDAKKVSKNNCFLCEQIIQAKTPEFKLRRLYVRVKLFSLQHRIDDFYKDFNTHQIEKLAYHCSHYKILGKHHIADIRHKAFESTPDDISTWSDSAKQFIF